MSDIVPAAIRGILTDSLTEKGMRQWWLVPNRYLGGRRPVELWRPNDRDDGPRLVREAAHAFSEGFYL